MAEETRTVLIVDDDPQILRLIASVLKSRKVRVLVAPRPSEALRICESQPIDLLISDMKMPDMDGIKLAGRVLKLYPEARVLLISGYFHSAPDGAKQIRFLAKPFFPSELIRHLSELLPGTEPATTS
jgi:two-component system, cell cycle sensor histidine kinase and response regulator CckA